MDWRARIVQAEAERDAGEPAIALALHSSDRELRLAGLWALGRIEEVGTATLAAPLLMDADPQVAAAAAFALGQIQGGTAVKAMQAALPYTRAKAATLRALSRAGTASVAADMARLLSDPAPEVRAEAALSLGLLNKRLPEVPAQYSAALVPLLGGPEPAVRFGAAYALARFADPQAAVALVRALGDPDPEVRMWAAVGLGRAGAHPGALDAVMRDPDWRVRAAAATALGASAAASVTEAPHAVARLDALASAAFARVAGEDRLAAGRALHVLRACISAAQVAGPPARRVLEHLEKATWETAHLPAGASADLGRVQCAAAAALDHLDKTARHVLSCGQGVFPQWRRRELWLDLTASQGGPKAGEAIAPYTLNADPKVRAAAMMALGSIVDAFTTEVLLSRLESNDLVVASAALEILLRPDRAGLRPTAFAERAWQVLLRLLAQPDDGLVVGALDGIGGMGEEARPLLGRLRELGTDPRPAVRRRAARARQAIEGTPVPFGRSVGAVSLAPPPRPLPTELVLETTRGQVVLALDGERAPRFTGLLSGLAAQGAYDGLTFHRVVSGFVTQGGCARGDGWGSPGYTVPGETSSNPFVRGAVGIASNGRDTGSMQLFFMHAYHPHLDGNYPWVGRVREGIEVVDALQPDDLILKAWVRSPRR